MEKQWLFWFDEIGTKDNALVGKKCANLGELTRMGLPVPSGFALSLAAYEKFLNETEAAQEIRDYFREKGRRNRTYPLHHHHIYHLGQHKPSPY